MKEKELFSKLKKTANNKDFIFVLDNGDTWVVFFNQMISSSVLRAFRFNRFLIIRTQIQPLYISDMYGKKISGIRIKPKIYNADGTSANLDDYTQKDLQSQCLAMVFPQKR